MEIIMYNRQEFVKKIIDISYHCKGGHVPSSLSVLDIIYVLYNNILNIKDIKELKKIEIDLY
jgi:transketolase N-terminal domain/subunit